MVYSLLYLPADVHHSLLADTHHFDDSKVLTPGTRSSLMEALCTPGNDLYRNCGWATTTISAQDISSGMLKPGAVYNLNAQAMDATIDLIKNIFSKGVNVKQIYIDTIGSPQVYQKKLERIFPTTAITVAKKADSLYPCVSAASVCAKVTRDAALKLCYQSQSKHDEHLVDSDISSDGWGSGYPSDGRCKAWLKETMDPVFGWGNECRFSWGTAKDLLETKGGGIKVDWAPDTDNDQSTFMADFLFGARDDQSNEAQRQSAQWFGVPAAEGAF